MNVYVCICICMYVMKKREESGRCCLICEYLFYSSHILLLANKRMDEPKITQDYVNKITSLTHSKVIIG